MAITIRFPNGQAIRYNDMAHVVTQNDGSTLLKRSETSGWSVHVPRECVIEFTHPSSVSNPLLSPQESIDIVIANIRSYNDGKLKQLKTLLEPFNRHTFRWRD